MAIDEHGKADDPRGYDPFVQGGPLEKDTCRDYVVPRLRAAGWSDDQIQMEFPITDGRIISIGSKHRRGDALRADYVLEYRPGVPIAVVEAKREHAIAGKGLQQAKNYARLLDLPFAYATNGKGIVEDDRDTGLETDNLDAFPGPTRTRLLEHRGRGRRPMETRRAPIAAGSATTVRSSNHAAGAAPESAARAH
jgi:type I site-specific restriction endonuclease